MRSLRARPGGGQRPNNQRPFGLLRAALLAVSLVFCSAIMETGLRLLTPFPIHSDDANRDPHEALGYVVSPVYPDIDSYGFRNPRDRESREGIDLFALGDSLTFGHNVASEHSWPQQLGHLAKLRVYNYGVGGYGILQYAYLFDHALERNPEHIVLGLYLANDFARFCQFARMAYWSKALAERGIETSECRAEVPLRSTWASRLVGGAKSSALGSALIYHLWYPLEEWLAGRGVDATAWELQYAGAGGMERTLLSLSRVENGRRVMDLSDPQTAAADRAARSLFEAMATAARQRGTRLSVLLIPSKENAILDSLAPGTPHLGAIRELVLRERSLIERYREFFQQLGVQTASGRTALTAALAGSSVYPESTDSHPLEAGYLAYAHAALPLVAAGRERQEATDSASGADTPRLMSVSGAGSPAGRRGGVDLRAHRDALESDRAGQSP